MTVKPEFLNPTKVAFKNEYIKQTDIFRYTEAKADPHHKEPWRKPANKRKTISNWIMDLYKGPEKAENSNTMGRHDFFLIM